MINVRHFNPENDYADVSAWWRAHKWPPIPREVLPFLGFIAESDQGKLAAQWVYEAKTGNICYIEFLISNPQADKLERKDAIDLVISKSLREAKERGYLFAYTSVKHPLLVPRLEKHGFAISDREMTNMTYQLQGGGI